MMPKLVVTLGLLLPLLAPDLPAGSRAAGPAPPPAVLPGEEDWTSEQLAFFEARIRPVLVKECFSCHSERTGKARGGLRLDTRDQMLLGGESGPAVVPGAPEESLLYRALLHDGLEMPPRRQLSAGVQADFRRWIEEGAADPRGKSAARVKATVSDKDVRTARKTFWAYQAPEAGEVPACDDASWPRTDVDRFVLARLESFGLEPSVDASPEVLLRRLSTDLLGLPPTLDETRAFVAAHQEDPEAAIAAAVDRMLASESFGERWGRHWLDVARFAESTGSAVNVTFPQAWRYRDWVIDAFNQDLPYDRFVREQLAGDLLPAKSDEERQRLLIATGFLALGTKNLNEMDGRQFDANLVDEQVDVTTRAFLATSVACARCHDHKFDAIQQRDYYALAGIFQSTETYWGHPGRQINPQVKQESDLIPLPLSDASPFDPSYTPSELRALEEEIRDLRFTLRSNRRRGAGVEGRDVRDVIRLGQLQDRRAAVDDDGQPLSFCMGARDAAAPQDAALLVRGEIDLPTDTVPRGVPAVLAKRPLRIGKDASGRLELAEWIASEDNPVTARVLVNRVWQHLLGRGIVATTEDFGATGQAPSHPELLDHLAVRFMDDGWSVKRLIREIACSRVYRMESFFDEDAHEVDPDNALLWRAHPRRLDAESMRDAMLAVSGELELGRVRGSEVARAGFVPVRDGRLGGGRGLTMLAEGMQRLAGMGEAEERGREEGTRPSRGNRSRGRPGAGRGAGSDASDAPEDADRGGRRPGFDPIARFDADGDGRWSREEAPERAAARFDVLDANGDGYLTADELPFGSRRGEGSRRTRGGEPSTEARPREEPELAQPRSGSRDELQPEARFDPLNATDARYRSVYLPRVRDEEPRVLEVFDLADANAIVGTRETSNTADQALFLMNNRFVLARSDAFAERLLSERETLEEQVVLAFELALGRAPTDGERESAASLLRSLRRKGPRQRLSALCQALFASAEFRLVL